MKVLLVTNYGPDRQESMLRFGRMLAEGLPSLGIQPIVIAPRARLTKLTPRYRYAGWPKYLGYIDKFFLFPHFLRHEIRRHRPDVVHIIDHANSVYASAAGERPVVATCHDLMQIRAARGEIPQQRLGWSGRLFQRWILRHIARVRDLVYISRKTGDDLHRLVSREQDYTHLIHVGLNYPYAKVPAATAAQRLNMLAAADGLGDKNEFYLNVGGGQWYKNRPGLLRIFAELRRQQTPAPLLVMIGKPLSAADAALASELGIAEHVRHFSNVSNEDLAAFYTLARGLIFPSWEEGFGWPIAEAQACGCPVFTSNRAPMTEVGGPAAVYFDPGDPVEAAGRILAARGEEAALRARGLLRAERWTARRMLGSYAELYRSLAARP
ncbi:MAG TPA: glycosyltransferase family 1 protein [Lacunisphaera sp.]|jgi:glycosyltransferase involved in cell wall biosynthesis